LDFLNGCLRFLDIVWLLAVHEVIRRKVLKPVRLDELTWDPTDSELKPGWIEEKIEEEKTWYDPADPTD
jgi:hypothetical protein